MRNTRGFTFVEAMVVVALFAIISLSLFSSFSMGLKVWKRSVGTNLDRRQALLGMERLTLDIRRIFDYPEIGFLGHSGQLQFANLYKEDIWNISYEYVPAEHAVYRRSLTMRQRKDDEDAQEREVMTGIERFECFFYGLDPETNYYGFLESWNYTQGGLPMAVKISLSLKDGEEFEKIISIPVVPRKA